MVNVPNGKWWKGFTNVRHSITKEWKNIRMKDCAEHSDCYAEVWWELVAEFRIMNCSFVYRAMGSILQLMRKDGLPWWFCGTETACQCRRCGFNPWVRKMPWRRKWPSTPVFLPGKSHGQRSLVGYCPWSCKGLGMT